MLELEDALEKILSAVQSLETEIIPLVDSMDRYLALPALSPIELPPFDNSAMDGYAVRAEDVASASLENPSLLRLTAKLAAGAVSTTPVDRGCCIRIFTGSPMPQGATAVVMQEDTQFDSLAADWIKVTDSVKPWENVRFAGEDVKRGAQIVAAGEKLTTSTCSLLAACGFSQASVSRQPVVGLLATGSELINPGQALEAGKIYESNRVGFSILARRAGAIPRLYPLVEDSLDATVSALDRAFRECDVVLTSGGVSVGEFDYVKPAFEKLGGDLSFWKVAIKPGKPFVFGRFGDKFLFGLPGNPVSALVTAFLLVRPALLRMQGASQITTHSHPVILSESVHNPGERRHFVRIHIDAEGNAKPAGIQASHILTSLAAANGLLDVPPKMVFAAGSVVRALRWD